MEIVATTRPVLSWPREQCMNTPDGYSVVQKTASSILSFGGPKICWLIRDWEFMDDDSFLPCEFVRTFRIGVQFHIVSHADTVQYSILQRSAVRPAIHSARLARSSECRVRCVAAHPQRANKAPETTASVIAVRILILDFIFSITTNRIRLSFVTGFAAVTFAHREPTNRFQLWVSDHGWSRLFIDRQTGHIYAHHKFQ